MSIFKPLYGHVVSTRILRTPNNCLPLSRGDQRHPLAHHARTGCQLAKNRKDMKTGRTDGFTSHLLEEYVKHTAIIGVVCSQDVQR